MMRGSFPLLLLHLSLQVVSSLSYTNKNDTCSVSSESMCISNDETSTLPRWCVDSSTCRRIDRHQCVEDFDRLSVECPQTCGMCYNDSTMEDNHTVAIRNLYSWNHPQYLLGSDDEIAATRAAIEKSDAYMHSIFLRQDDRWNCANQDPHCSYWASRGECEKNPSHMLLHCAPACLNCTSPKTGCSTNLTQSVWKAGDLNRMFQRAVKLYDKAKVHSSPRTDGPWVVSIDNFLSSDECTTLISVASDKGFTKSTVGGADIHGKAIYNEDAQQRTSSTMWCTEFACTKNATVVAIRKRIRDLTNGIPTDNFERNQFLRYYPQQYYKEHHDYIDSHVDSPGGSRILTAFLYLNDVEEGGGTAFPQLNTTVTPKAGRILIWPSVLDNHPHEIDHRTTHEAQAVIKGVKYASNIWIHPRDWETPQRLRC